MVNKNKIIFVGINRINRRRLYITKNNFKRKTNSKRGSSERGFVTCINEA